LSELLVRLERPSTVKAEVRVISAGS